MLILDRADRFKPAVFKAHPDKSITALLAKALGAREQLKYPSIVLLSVRGSSACWEAVSGHDTAWVSKMNKRTRNINLSCGQ